MLWCHAGGYQAGDRGTLGGACSSLKATGIKINTCVVTGAPFLEIIRMALRYHHDLVMKAVEPEREWKQTFFGSTECRNVVLDIEEASGDTRKFIF